MSAAAAVGVHAHETVGEDAVAEEAPKLALDEPGNGAFTSLPLAAPPLLFTRTWGGFDRFQVSTGWR